MLAAAAIVVVSTAAPTQSSATSSSPPALTPQVVAAQVEGMLADRSLAWQRASRLVPMPQRHLQPIPDPPPPPKPRPAATHPPAVRLQLALPDAGRAAAVLAFALAQVGDRYVWGAAGPNSWDCSGLAMKAYAKVGIRLPHTTYGMLERGRPVARSQLRPGDLVFPHRGHVQIYLGAGKVVEAATSGVPVRVTRLWGFLTARRLL